MSIASIIQGWQLWVFWVVGLMGFLGTHRSPMGFLGFLKTSVFKIFYFYSPVLIKLEFLFSIFRIS